MKLVLAVLLLISALSFSAVQTKAESGCVLSGYTSMGVPTSQAGGSFSCGSDSGPRYLQVCLMKYSTAWACTPQLYYSGTSGSGIARDSSCYWTADIYTWHVWVWLYGEDHSTQVWQGDYRNVWINC
jgi:hypothetical protein